MGYMGKACEQKMCPNGCSRHGRCNGVTGKCECDIGYGGTDCSQPVCPDCDNGDCGDDATCLCQIGFEGTTCSEKSCAEGCDSDGGKCNEGECFCPQGLIGLECETTQEVCPNGCSGNGVCDDLTKLCHCKEGFGGHGCALRTCIKGCNEPHGQCYNGTCYCQPEYSGETCADADCPGNCNGNGVCNLESHTCSCNPGW